MGIPQIIVIVLWALNLGIALVQHGKPSKGNESIWNTLIGLGITIPLLVWGGFFG